MAEPETALPLCNERLDESEGLLGIPCEHQQHHNERPQAHQDIGDVKLQSGNPPSLLSDSRCFHRLHRFLTVARPLRS